MQPIAAKVRFHLVKGFKTRQLFPQSAVHGDELPAPDDTAMVSGVAEVGVHDLLSEIAKFAHRHLK